MRVSINQEKLTLEIEKFLKRLKRERTKWYGFYSQGRVKLEVRHKPPN